MSAQPLDDRAIAARLSALAGWEARDGALAKTFEFDDFRSAFAWMGQIAEEAERAAHHPDWRNVYGTVEVRLSTHDAGGITELDFALAQFMDGAFDGRSAD
jgi:4a-hydroxytetrahydrobiopterin dehydratase